MIKDFAKENFDDDKYNRPFHRSSLTYGQHDENFNDQDYFSDEQESYSTNTIERVVSENDIKTYGISKPKRIVRKFKLK